MAELLPFFIVIFAAVFFSELFLRFKFPWVVALIIGGILIGPSFLGIFEVNQTLGFLGQIGLVFLMFMAGLETNLLSKRHTHRGSWDNIIRIALISSIIPFVVGILIALSFGFDKTTSVLIGVIFISSSLAAIVPTLEAKGLLRCSLGRNIVSSVVISDVLSLIALSFTLQYIDPRANLPLPIFYLILFVILMIMKWIIPKIRWFIKSELKTAKDVYQHELRSIFVILMGTAVIFELLGLHSIVAGFFAGVVLSDSVRNPILKEKIRAISYGVFIPIFFVVVGSQTDFQLLFKEQIVLWLMIVLVAFGIVTKLVSGFLGGKLAGLDRKESLILGSATVPQLSTTLAVAFAGFELGILSQEIVTAIVGMSIFTTVVGGLLISYFSRNYVREETEYTQDKVLSHYD